MYPTTAIHSTSVPTHVKEIHTVVAENKSRNAFHTRFTTCKLYGKMAFTRTERKHINDETEN